MSDYTQIPLPFPPETVEIPLSKNGIKHAGKYITIVDAIDADLAEFSWVVRSSGKNKYVQRMTTGTNRKTIQIHRIIMERILKRPLVKGELVDHIDQNALNNLRANLRLADKFQNKQNSRRYTNNTSGYKGVSWIKPTKKWKAGIVVNGKAMYLGCFETSEDAYKAYCEAAEEHFGEFANLDNGVINPNAKRGRHG